MNALRWSPDGRRLVVELQDQMVASGAIVVVDADGTRQADFAGNTAAWADDDTLVVLTFDTGRFEGSVRTVDLADPRSEPRQIADDAGWILPGPRGLVAIDGSAGPGADGSFRLLAGGVLGPAIDGRGWPFAFSADGRRLVVEHAWIGAADSATLASTGSPELGWLEVLRSWPRASRPSRHAHRATPPGEADAAG
jgi:hypothetical protein